MAPGHTHFHHSYGLLSDTRIAASMVDLCGTAVLDCFPGRWVFFDRDFTEPYGDWRKWQGMRYRKGAVAIADMHRKMCFTKKPENAVEERLLEFPGGFGHAGHFFSESRA